jgi:predicted Na+-dependent transporter
MTFVSTLASLVVMPAWLYTLGSIFTNAANIKIPFSRLIINLFITIGPCLFGLTLSHFFPKIKKFVLKIAKPFTLLTVLSFLVFTIYVRFYVFTLVELRQWLIAPFIPWCGFIIGGSAALLFRLPFKQAITVALETGIQNIGIAFLIIYYNFPSPESKSFYFDKFRLFLLQV